MKMHILYYRRLHGVSWSPYLALNDYSVGATGVVVMDSSATDRGTLLGEISDSMDLDSVEQLKWVEVEPLLD